MEHSVFSISSTVVGELVIILNYASCRYVMDFITVDAMVRPISVWAIRRVGGIMDVANTNMLIVVRISIENVIVGVAALMDKPLEVVADAVDIELIKKDFMLRVVAIMDISHTSIENTFTDFHLELINIIVVLGDIVDV